MRLFIAGMAYMVDQMKFQLILLKILAFLLPFSVEIGVAPGSMLRVPTEPLIALAGCLLLMDVIRYPAKWKTFVFKELVWVFPLLLVYVITTAFSEIITVSVKFSLLNLLYILVFYVFMIRVFRQYPRLFPQMLLFYGLGVMVVALWAIYQFGQYDWNPVVARGIFRPFYNDHTIFGASVALLGVFWTAAAIFQANNRYLFFSLGVFFILAALFSTSRAAFFSLFFAAAMYLVYLKRAKLHYILMILTVMIMVGVVFQKPILERLHTVEVVSYGDNANFIDRTVSVSNITTDVSNLERINRWISAWRMFKEKPLTGFGPGTYQFTYIPYQDPAYMSRLTVTDPHDIPDGSGGTAHSEYLLALSEMGVFGLLAWLLLIGRWFYVVFGLPREHPRIIYITVAFLALSTYLFHALVNNFLATDKFAFLFWSTAAWMVANYHISAGSRMGRGLLNVKR